MLSYFRYALATICFTLSAACLELWRWTSTNSNHGADAAYCAFDVEVRVEAVRGMAGVLFDRMPISNEGVRFEISELEPMAQAFHETFFQEEGHRFGCGDDSVYFPLWFAALSFAVAGVSCLCFPRRFTIRSAIVAMTVVAGLLGMVVAL